MITKLLPVIVFIIVSISLYLFSKDADKNKKPLNFVLPGAVAALAVFLYFKYKGSNEPMMQGNYFE